MRSAQPDCKLRTRANRGFGYRGAMPSGPDQRRGGAQKGPIAVYGATGYTGALISRELGRRGADFQIAGRDADKLASLSAALDGVPATAVSLGDSAGLRRLLEPCSAVVACAGPFGLYGEPILAAAVESGTHYLDTTGEQAFIRMALDRYGERAAQKGIALVPGMGFDYAPGDLIAARTAEGMGPLEEIVIAYCVHGFAPTQGTALSALEIMRGGDWVWRDGRLSPAPRSADGGRWRFPEPIGEQRTLRYPAGEQITVPRHVQTAAVRTLLSGMVVPPALMPLAASATPILGLAMRTPLRAAAASLIRRLPRGPNEHDRKAARFLISCEARAGSRTRRATVRGGDVYGLTAATLSQGALLCSDPSYERCGALAPAQAFDPASFLAALAEHGVNAEVEPLPEPALENPIR
jgi:short subunit dehydrogenase-like uncharacterized protein